MSAIDDYHASLSPEVKKEFEHIRQVVHELVPDVEEGTKYGMASYIYRGKGVVSAVANKHFLSLYPFSGKVGVTLADKLTAFEGTTGSIHFSLEKPIPDELLREIIQTRLKEITAKA